MKTNQLTLEDRNEVLLQMAKLIETNEQKILDANQKDIEAYNDDDIAMYDRLKVDKDKIKGMIASLKQLANLSDPLGIERFSHVHENGMRISNKTAPFGTILIIYESRPDVTIEAAGIAFKSGNKILLKGGKEALNSNLCLTDLWHQALESVNTTINWVTYLNYNRRETQAFLEKPSQTVDLIVPRGGERLIEFVKKHARCAVIVSGRGNNFLYVDKDADLSMAQDVILNAKTAKISACNALDKVLISNELPNKKNFIKELMTLLKDSNVSVGVEKDFGIEVADFLVEDEDIWYEEFLDYKIILGNVNSIDQATEKINQYSGGHSATIITENQDTAQHFMQNVDVAAVYHNVSTRFTDGFALGLGGELAISTDKLHQRGPIGLQHLVTNKWYIHGEGQIR